MAVHLNNLTLIAFPDAELEALVALLWRSRRAGWQGVDGVARQRLETLLVDLEEAHAARPDRVAAEPVRAAVAALDCAQESISPDHVRFEVSRAVAPLRALLSPWRNEHPDG